MTKAQGRKGNPDSSTSSFTGQPGEKQFDNMITHFVRCFIIMFIEIPLAVCFIKCFIICFPKWTDQPINQLTERPSDRPDQPSKSVSQFWLSIDSKSNIQGRNRIQLGAYQIGKRCRSFMLVEYTFGLQPNGNDIQYNTEICFQRGMCVSLVHLINVRRKLEFTDCVISQGH